MAHFNFQAFFALRADVVAHVEHPLEEVQTKLRLTPFHDSQITQNSAPRSQTGVHIIALFTPLLEGFLLDIFRKKAVRYVC